jgi:serine/threonine protein kinase
MAPEACLGKQSMRSDFYSLGMVCRELILGGQEYGATEFTEPEKLIRYVIAQKKCMKPLRDTDQDSQKLMNIVNKLTAYDRNDRYDEDCLELLSDINSFINILDKEVIK